MKLYKRNFLTLKQKEIITETFEVFDCENQDKMLLSELRAALIALNLNLNDDEINRTINYAKREILGSKDYLTLNDFTDIVAMRVVNIFHYFKIK